MKILTILTTTYNRKKLLKSLYESLEKQICKNFKWVVVDDGSTDGTYEYIKSLVSSASFDILIYKKENGGKHSALNLGISKINTKYTMIVDSDDILGPNAVSTIMEYDLKYGEKKDLGAFSFLRCYRNGEPIVNIEKNEFIDTYANYRVKHNHPGDMAEVFVTSVLKKYPFPVYKNEKFLSEDVVWIQMSGKYKYVFINKAIYVCEYLREGLTSKDKSMKFASPLGSMQRGKMLMERQCGIKANIKGAIIYDCYKIVAKKLYSKNELRDKVLLDNGLAKILCFFVTPISLIYYKKWGKQNDD